MSLCIGSFSTAQSQIPFTDDDWFSLGGIPGSSGRVNAMVFDDQGNLYVGGVFFVVGDAIANYVAKWDGHSWSALPSEIDGNPYTEVMALAISGSDLYVGGRFITAGGVTVNNIAKWDGRKWSALAGGLHSSSYGANVSALAISGTNLYAGGSFTNVGGEAAWNVAMWDGHNWSAFETLAPDRLPDHATSLAVFGTNVLAGTSQGLYKWIQRDYGPNFWAYVANGYGGSFALVVSGSELYSGNHGYLGYTPTVTKLLEGGYYASLVGPLLYGRLFSLAVSSNGIYAGGSFGLTNNFWSSVVKLDGTNWTPIDPGLQYAYQPVMAMTMRGSDLYAGGDFSRIGGISADNIAKWNGSAWSRLGGGMSDEVRVLAALGGNVYAGGYFQSAGKVDANFIAKWNGTNWSSLGFAPITLYEGWGINAMAVSGSNLYVGGAFYTAGPLNATNIARWDGHEWSALGSGVYGGVYAIAVSGNDVYAGGDLFDPNSEYPESCVMKWDGSSWSELGCGGVQITSMAIIGRDLYVGSVSGISKWDGMNWSSVGFGVNNSVKALVVRGTDLYVGGYFTQAGGFPANGVAKWDGTSWSALGSGVSGGVRALAFVGDDLYAGGSFTNANGVSARRVAKWNGTEWSPLGSGVNDFVYALAGVGGDLYVGGEFLVAGGKAAGRVARARVASPQQLAEGLMTRLATLISQGVLDGGTANALAASLRETIAALERGRTTPACNGLRTFTNKVQQSIRQGDLNRGDGQSLTDAAASLSLSLGCR